MRGPRAYETRMRLPYRAPGSTRAVRRVEHRPEEENSQITITVLLGLS